MAAMLDEDTELKVATQTADSFIKSFYRAFEHTVQRATLATYFLEKTSAEAGGFPVINFNGSILEAADFQKMAEEFPVTRFEIACLDAQTVNVALQVADRTADDAKRGKNMSILVLISGSMIIGKKEDNNKRLFSDSFILVPNPKAVPGRRERGHKEWLIQTYTSRIVAS